MPIAPTVASSLAHHRLRYALICHRPVTSCREAAAAATTPPAQIAKSVLLRDAHGYVLAVVPGDRTVALDRLSRVLGRELRMVAESELPALFPDCEIGAIPPLGPAYAIETVVDQELLAQPRICFVPGTRAALVCVARDDFLRLVPGARRERIAAAARGARARAFVPDHAALGTTH